MEFLKELVEAQALGLTKEEFIPIYMQDLRLKLASLPGNESSNNWDAGENQASGGEARHENPLDQQTVPQGSQQLCSSSPTDQVIIDAMKASHVQISNTVYSNLKTMKEDNQHTREHLSNAQQELYFVLKEILSNIESLKTKEPEPLSRESSRIEYDGKISPYTQLSQDLEDTKQFFKLKVSEAQTGITEEIKQCAQIQLSGHLKQTQRQEQLFQQQTTMMQAQQQQLSLFKQNVEQICVRLEAGLVQKFENLCATLIFGMKEQEALQKLTLQAVSNLATFPSFFTMSNKVLAAIDEMKMDHFIQNQSMQETLSQLQSSLLGNNSTLTHWHSKFSDLEEASSADQQTQQAEEPVDEGHLYNDEDDAVVADSGTIGYDLNVQNVQLSVGSDKEATSVQYCSLLDCCFRASVFFPSVSGQESVLDVTLDMCQVGKDASMPDFFRIATEITLKDLAGNQQCWVVGRERGVFNIPKLSTHGWYEVASVTLNSDDLETYGFIYEDCISVHFNIKALNELKETVLEIRHNSINEDDEFFDASEVTEEYKKDVRKEQGKEKQTKESEEKIGLQQKEKKGKKQDKGRGGELSGREIAGTKNYLAEEHKKYPSEEELEERIEDQGERSGKPHDDGEEPNEGQQKYQDVEQQNDKEGDQQSDKEQVRQVDKKGEQQSDKEEERQNDKEEEQQNGKEEEQQSDKEEERQNDKEEKHKEEEPAEDEESLDLEAPHSSYLLHVPDLEELKGSNSIFDGPNWYMQFLGHSIRAVLAFVDDSIVISLDFFNGSCDDNLPEIAFFKCQVLLMDLTDQMDDQKLGETMEMFDMTRDTSVEWTDNCVCIVPYEVLECERFSGSNEIVLKFEFYDLA